MELIIGLVIAAGLGLIPAYIAKNKGYSFAAWWFYGWMLFIVAIIHVNLIPDKNAQQPSNVQDSNPQYQQPNQYQQQYSQYQRSPVSPQSAADELKKYKELLDEGVLTEEEFKTKKEQLLRTM